MKSYTIADTIATFALCCNRRRLLWIWICL